MIEVSDAFHKQARGQVICPRVGCRFAFDRNSTVRKYFTLDDSVLNGPDLLAPNTDNPIQSWDEYNYLDYSDRLVSMEYSRSVEFPYGTQTALADVSMDNFDDYFTPGSGSTVSPYNYPKRPIRLVAGFDQTEQVQQFVGLTQDMPTIDNSARVAKYHATDFLAEIATMNLSQVVVGQDMRTDQVLKLIFDQFGVLETQESFEHGANVIPFVFFDVGENAGDVIRKLIQAEGGRLWLDEEGVLKFQARTTTSDDPVFNFADYQVIKMAPSSSSRIVNHIVVEADIREVQEWQTIYTKASSASSVNESLWVIPANGTITRELSLEDPCLAITAPELGKNADVSWFSVKTSGGVEVLTGVSAVGTLTSNSYNITFTNTNNQALEVDEISLWGEPAKIVDRINYDLRDTMSEGRFGEQLMEIKDNQFFQDNDQVDSYARYLISEYANYGATYEAEVKGDFSIQLGDMVQFDSTCEISGRFIVEAISYVIGVGSMTTKLKLHPHRLGSDFILDHSKLMNAKTDNGDRLG